MLNGTLRKGAQSIRVTNETDKFQEFTSESLNWEPTWLEPSGLRAGTKFKRASRLVQSITGLPLQRNKAIEMASELASAEAERSAFDKSWRQKAMEDLLSASRDRDGINEQLAKADKRRQMVRVAAPVDAVVLVDRIVASVGAGTATPVELDAGADLIETNTFGATTIAQGDFELEALAYEMNVAAARLAVEARDEMERRDT